MDCLARTYIARYHVFRYIINIIYPHPYIYVFVLLRNPWRVENYSRMIISYKI